MCDEEEIFEFLEDDIDNSRKKTKNKIQRNIIRNMIKPFEMQDGMFLQRYRLSKECVLELCNEIRPFMSQPTKSTDLSVEVKVLITLSFYATGSYQRPTGDIAAHSVAQQTISAVIKQVTHSLNLLHFRQKYIKFPNSANERRATIVGNFNTLRLNEDELTSSSDEKMDTGSESFQSQDTPNSVLSSDFEGDHPEPVLRLQNPEILRLSAPEQLNDSLISKMSNLNIESPKLDVKAPKNLGISPPKFNSTLTLTTSHPLMSPDENYPDLIPKKLHKIEDEKDLSLSSIEDERNGENNGFYSPQRNTSKNNLYFSEAFVTAESHDLDLTVPPDVARVDKVERRKIVSKLREATPQKGDFLGFIEERTVKQSTPKSVPVDIIEKEEFHSVAEWCESPSHLRTLPNFELPIEMSSSIGLHNELESPDVISASTAEDRSAYQALLDPRTGRAALRHTPAPHRHSPAGQRRKIHLPPEVEEDRCSLDSVSVCSMESEEEPPEPEPELGETPQPVPQDLCDNSVSKSTNTLSECSDPIPEYSAAEEFSNERAWISVPRGNGHAICDMKVIEPFKRVVSHGGYDARGAALIVFSACHLPDAARSDYTYVMDNLFLYVIWTLERLVTDEYVLVYLHGSAGRRRLPTFHWLHQCYKLIDRRLRKSLKHLYLVHPTFWLKSFVILTKPFVSSKFFRKLSYVRSLAELMQQVPVEPNAIPEVVKQFDATKR